MTLDSSHVSSDGGRCSCENSWHLRSGRHCRQLSGASTSSVVVWHTTSARTKYKSDLYFEFPPSLDLVRFATSVASSSSSWFSSSSGSRLVLVHHAFAPSLSLFPVRPRLAVPRLALQRCSKQPRAHRWPAATPLDRFVYLRAAGPCGHRVVEGRRRSVPADTRHRSG